MIVCSSSSPTYPSRIWSGFLSYLQSPEFDLLFLGFLGHPFALFGRQLTRTRIILDAFMSPYDTICYDRAYFHHASLPGKILRRLESSAYEQVDKVLFDTRTHVEYVSNEFKSSREKFSHVYLGADEEVFRPEPKMDRADRTVNVLWYGSFLPLHGVETIVEAIDLVSARSQIIFTIVGQGMRSRDFVRWFKRRENSRITYIPWLSLQQLGAHMRKADIFLGGHFSLIPKASRVVPVKAYEGAASGKALILGDNLANREVFTPSKDSVFVEMGNSEALADAIEGLASDPSLIDELGRRAFETYMRTASIQRLATELDVILRSVLEQ